MLAWWEMPVRMLLAALLGVLLGWERESRGKPAGLRTLALVSVSAALFVLAGSEAARRAGEPFDAMRGMAGIAGGVGFLGAGLIVLSQRGVHVPAQVGGKPVDCLCLNSLWGVALP